MSVAAVTHNTKRHITSMRRDVSFVRVRGFKASFIRRRFLASGTSISTGDKEPRVEGRRWVFCFYMYFQCVEFKLQAWLV